LEGWLTATQLTAGSK